MEIKVGSQTVDLDPANLEVDEGSMNDFLKKFAGKYNHFNAMWATAQYLQHLAEDRYDTISSARFQHLKDHEGGSDKLVEAKVKVSEDVIAARKAAREAKLVTQLLHAYLRSLDKAHEDALNLGYNIRKEMDKIFPQAVKGHAHDVFDIANADEAVANLFKAD